MKLPWTKPKYWTYRWVQLAERGVLHRVRHAEDRRSWLIDKRGTAETVCGKTGTAWMPGFLSRLGCPRCARCCRALDLRRGLGSPYNDPAVLGHPEASPLRSEAKR